MSGAEPRPPSRLLNPSSTAAVVLGAHDWSEAGLGRAPSFLRSARSIVRYLYDPAGLGLDPELVLDLFDDTAAAGDQLARMRDTLNVLLRARQETGRPVADVLVYYVGHGYTDDQNQLSLLVRRSRQALEAETGIKASDLARVLRLSAPKQRRSIILDCCFSEAAAKTFIGMGDLNQQVAATAMNDLKDERPARGTLLLCSSPVGQVSMGPPNAERTLFTGAVLDVLQKGEKGLPQYLSFADLRDAAFDRMVVSFGPLAPRPVLHQANAAQGDLTRAPAFPNRAAQAKSRRERKQRQRAEQQRLQEEADSKRQADEERHRRDVEAQKQRAEQQRLQEEADSKRQADEERHRRDVEAQKQRAEQQRLQEEADSKRQADEERHRRDVEAQKQRAEQQRLQEEADSKRQADEERHRRDVEAQKQRAEQQRLQEEADSKRQADEERRRRHGYGINMFCMSLMKEENRRAFKANEAEYLKKFNLTPEQTDAILKRDHKRLYELGGDIFFIVKLGAKGQHEREAEAQIQNAEQQPLQKGSDAKRNLRHYQRPLVLMGLLVVVVAAITFTLFQLRLSTPLTTDELVNRLQYDGHYEVSEGKPWALRFYNDGTVLLGFAGSKLDNKQGYYYQKGTFTRTGNEISLLIPTASALTIKGNGTIGPKGDSLALHLNADGTDTRYLFTLTSDSQPPVTSGANPGDTAVRYNGTYEVSEGKPWALRFYNDGTVLLGFAGSKLDNKQGYYYQKGTFTSSLLKNPRHGESVVI